MQFRRPWTMAAALMQLLPMQLLSIWPVLVVTARRGSGSLSLYQYNNTAMAGVASSRSSLKTLSLSLPGSTPFSAEVSGTLSPNNPAVSWWSFECTFAQVDFAFIRIDGHMVCQHGAYNNSGPLDPGRFRLHSKRRGLVIAADIYHVHPSAEPVSMSLRWCAEGDITRCELLPATALSPMLPNFEQKRRTVQRDMARGWGSWLHRDALSVTLLPDSATLTVMLCRISTGECMREANIDGNGGGGTDHTHPVRVGSHAIDHSYSQMYAWGPALSLAKLNVSIEYAVGGDDGRDLDLLITPVASGHPTDENAAQFDDFAVAIAGSFSWNRVGTSTVNGLQQMVLHGYGLPVIELTSTVNALSHSLPGVVAPGLLRGEACQFGTKKCGAQTCAQNAPAGIACSSGVCHTPPGAPWAEGYCTQPEQLPHLALPVRNGPVGITTRRAAGATLNSIQRRIAAAAARQRLHEQRFGKEHADLAQALGAAVSWRNIAVPAEAGPLMPTTYGFSWIDDGPSSNDWRYIQFCWDNILASYTAGVLGYKMAAYSNLIAIVKAKANDGYVPNHAAGGAVSSTAEPAVGGKVLLELYKRFHDDWIVELLLDDLIDWNEWQWERRRVIGPYGGLCAEPGFISIGNDYENCSTAVFAASNCPGGGESGLDQSPLWDCPGANPDGSGGNCSVYTYRNPRSSPHVLQLADMQSTSLYVLDAESIATLAEVINHTDGGLVTRLRSRAAQMRSQLAKAWDPRTLSFRDIYVETSEFSDKLTPTAFYPLFAGVATDGQAVSTVQRHLLNDSEFCISADYARNPSSRCYWGLPSISANAPSYMKPLRYVYWRGLSWGPMTMLTWWALDAYHYLPQIKAARTLLAKQKTDMMMTMWRSKRHICENYSPYAPNSTVVPGTNNGGQRNDECTGWQFYHWGALNGLTTLLEVGA